MTCPLPAVIQSGQTGITIGRAWPTTGAEMRFEGTDDAGRIRAGTITLGATSKVKLLDHGQDRKLPDLPMAMADGELIVHRTGKRAVVCRSEQYVKVVRPGDAAQFAQSAEVGRARAVKAGMSAPKVLRSGSGWLCTSIVPGVALHSAAKTATAQQWQSWWGQWARQWPRFVLTDQQGLDQFTAADESNVLRAAVDRALAWGALPDPTGRGRQLTAEVCSSLSQFASPQSGVAHRDLHDKQLLAGPDGIGVLDFDTVCVAEPALDLANLAVHSRWRATQGVWSSEQAAIACETVRRVARNLDVPQERYATYAASTSLRLAALYAFRPRWANAAVSWWQHQMKELPQ